MKTRPLFFLATFLAIPLLVGTLLAPWIYWGIHQLAHLPVFSELAQDRFERVATRAVQVAALALVWPCLRYSGTITRVAPALHWNAGRGWCLLRWCALGVANIALIYAIGFAVGLYEVDPKHWGTIRMLTRPLEFLVGAIFVGALEEYLFRGFIFGVLQSRFSIVSSAVLSSAIFSGVHFLRPRLPAPLEEITWSSGFQLFPHMFALFRPQYDWDFALTLFLMGMTLCALLMRHRHLYGIAGLHIGWVWALQTANAFVNQSPRQHYFWFGWGDNVAQGALATVVIAGFAAYAWRAWLADRHCQSTPPSSTTSA